MSSSTEAAADARPTKRKCSADESSDEPAQKTARTDGPSSSARTAAAAAVAAAADADADAEQAGEVQRRLAAILAASKEETITLRRRARRNARKELKWRLCPPFTQADCENIWTYAQLINAGPDPDACVDARDKGLPDYILDDSDVDSSAMLFTKAYGGYTRQFVRAVSRLLHKDIRANNVSCDASTTGEFEVTQYCVPRHMRVPLTEGDDEWLAEKIFSDYDHKLPHGEGSGDDEGDESDSEFDHDDSVPELTSNVMGSGYFIVRVESKCGPEVNAVVEKGLKARFGKYYHVSTSVDGVFDVVARKIPLDEGV